MHSQCVPGPHSLQRGSLLPPQLPGVTGTSLPCLLVTQASPCVPSLSLLSLIRTPVPVWPHPN